MHLMMTNLHQLVIEQSVIYLINLTASPYLNHAVMLQNKMNHRQVSLARTNALQIIIRTEGYLSYLARVYKTSCDICKDLLVQHKTNADLTDPSVALIAKKDRGGLVYPSAWLVKLVNVMERGLRLINDDDTAKLRSEKHLLALVRATMGAPPNTHSQHAVDTQDGIRNHIADLIEAVVKKFHQARIH